MRNIEAYLDIDALVARGGSLSDGDVFQVLEIPRKYSRAKCRCRSDESIHRQLYFDMDFAGGDDIIDGADITSTGFLKRGSNGQTNTVVGSAISTYTQFITSTDTIDCTIAGVIPNTGRLRVYATVIDLAGHD